MFGRLQRQKIHLGMCFRHGQIEHKIDLGVVEKFLHGISLAHAMFGGFPAGAFAIQIRTGGDLRELAKSFETVKVGIADRATPDKADPQWRRYLCWIYHHAQATLSYFFILSRSSAANLGLIMKSNPGAVI